MKLSVSVTDDDVDFIDRYATSHGLTSRSAVFQKAVRLLRDAELAGDYAAAFDDWEQSDDAGLWDASASDGLAAA